MEGDREQQEACLPSCYPANLYPHCKPQFPRQQQRGWSSGRLWEGQPGEGLPATAWTGWGYTSPGGLEEASKQLLIRKHCLIGKVYGAKQGVSLGEMVKATHESFETELDKELKEK